MEDLTSVIEDSITDAELPTDTPDPEPAVEASPEAPEATVATPEPEATTTTTDVNVEAPKPTDDFEKKFGIPAQSAAGRENRIPYSRVKKITEKAAAEAVAAKVKEYETTHTPLTKYSELETKVKDWEPKIKDYEHRLGQVAQFEDVMVNDVPRFLTMLSRLPQYTAILAPLFGGQAQTPAQHVVDPDNGMPQPDQTLSDGSTAYSLEGLKKLREWDRQQVEASVTRKMEERYKPIEDDYRSYQTRQALIPTVQKQIDEARKWPLFNDHENDITKVLQDNPTFNLERAYQYVVLPKLQANAQVNRDTLRQELLKEIKAAPTSTSVPSKSVKAAPAAPSVGPRSLEDVIKESLQGANLA